MEYQIIISNTTDLLRVSVRDILAIRADGNYCRVIMTDGEERLVAFQLGQLERMISEQLGGNASVLARIGKSAVINMDYLYTIDLRNQEMSLRSPLGHKVKLAPSKDALRQLKAYFDNLIAKGGTE